jgi:hypothetical protein
MESHKKIIYLFGLLIFVAVLPVNFTVFHVQAGAPAKQENCPDPDGRPIPTEYDSNLPVFAEARMLPRAEWEEAKSKGVSLYVIVINPERYYLGRYTQIWLFRRQCARIQKMGKAISQGYRRLNMRDEQQVDCMAVEAMQSDPDIRLSNRTIESIERDIERLIRNKRWGEVIAGPQRRISLKRCMSSK